MIFGKYINRYYLKNAPVLLLGLLALLMVDYIQLLIPQFYRLAYLLFRLRCAGCCQPARADV